MHFEHTQRLHQKTASSFLTSLWRQSSGGTWLQPHCAGCCAPILYDTSGDEFIMHYLFIIISLLSWTRRLKIQRSCWSLRVPAPPSVQRLVKDKLPFFAKVIIMNCSVLYWSVTINHLFFPGSERWKGRWFWSWRSGTFYLSTLWHLLNDEILFSIRAFTYIYIYSQPPCYP